jgi:hypothetical protein
MSTAELLISKLERELSYHEYIRTSGWWLNHINRLVTEYPFLKIGAKIKIEIDDEPIICKVQSFIIGDGILIETGFGNVYYYETKKA